ncbi:MAG: hypothetical protein GX242_00310 [Clostridiales bacterium]|nr:hypothetical protein [Clostridiales bacterium]
MSKVYLTKTPNTVKDDIYYLIKNGEISFFYKEFLLFKHNKNNPVISVILSKGEVEKEIPLINYDINKLNINEYNIEFYYQIYKIKVYIKLVDNILTIKVKNKNNYYGIKLSVKNSVGKIYGFGLNKEEISVGKEFCSGLFYCKNNNNLFTDNILAFHKEKKYYLHALGNYEWKMRIGSLLEMYFKKTSKVKINVAFCKDITWFCNYAPKPLGNLFEQKKYVVKTTTDKLDDILMNSKNIEAVIFVDDYIDFWHLKTIREKLKKRYNIKVIRQVQPKIAENDDYFNEFKSIDFVKSNNGKVYVENGKEKMYYFDLSNMDTYRKVKNYIRRILGTNIDGLISKEKQNILIEKKEYKDIYNMISLRWQKILYEASLEYYLPKTLIYDTLTPYTYRYGYYVVDIKNLTKTKYKKQLNNLKHSGITNIIINLSKGVRKRKLKKNLTKNYNVIYAKLKCCILSKK